jgi:hypothetical protein
MSDQDQNPRQSQPVLDYERQEPSDDGPPSTPLEGLMLGILFNLGAIPASLIVGYLLSLGTPIAIVIAFVAWAVMLGFVATALNSFQAIATFLITAITIATLVVAVYI